MDVDPPEVRAAKENWVGIAEDISFDGKFLFDLRSRTMKTILSKVLLSTNRLLNNNLVSQFKNCLFLKQPRSFFFFFWLKKKLKIPNIFAKNNRLFGVFMPILPKSEYLSFSPLFLFDRGSKYQGNLRNFYGRKIMIVTRPNYIGEFPNIFRRFPLRKYISGITPICRSVMQTTADAIFIRESCELL